MDERTIISVREGSVAERSGLRIGDVILSVNGNRVADYIDWNFLCCDEDFLLVEFQRDGMTRTVNLELYGDEVGVELAPMKIRRCGNKCVFCFVDQQPKGLRETLYIKDEDFRFSFLHGSYITMTNISATDWRRIERQRLSPLYVSVHSTDEAVRRKMLGNDRIPPIMEQLRRLVEANIFFHAQIVLVPGYNDGDNLARTVDDLLGFYPNIVSLAIVPVGLTEHRIGLPHLEPVSPKLAEQIVKWHYSLRDSDERAEKIFQLADEFFIIANSEIPDADYYRDFPQIENGIGMVRRFIDGAQKWRQSDFPKIENRTIVVITGKLFAPILLKTAFQKLCDFTGADVKLLSVENALFGKTVTVANLLSAKDFILAIEDVGGKDMIAILPPDIVNDSGLFLDGMTIDELQDLLKTPVFCAPRDASEMGEFLSQIVERL